MKSCHGKTKPNRLEGLVRARIVLDPLYARQSFLCQIPHQARHSDVSELVHYIKESDRNVQVDGG